MPWEAPGPGSGTQVDPSVLSFYARRIKTAMTRNDGERLWIRIPPNTHLSVLPAGREKRREVNTGPTTLLQSQEFPIKSLMAEEIIQYPEALRSKSNA